MARQRGGKKVVDIRDGAGASRGTNSSGTGVENGGDITTGQSRTATSAIVNFRLLYRRAASSFPDFRVALIQDPPPPPGYCHDIVGGSTGIKRRIVPIVVRKRKKKRI